MELLILIGIILFAGLVGSIIVKIYDYVQMSRWMRQRHLRELKLAMMQLEHPEFFSRTYDVSADEIRKALDIYRVSEGRSNLPTGEVEVINEAIQEANNRTVD